MNRAASIKWSKGSEVISELWIVSTELVSCHISISLNLEGAPIFWKIFLHLFLHIFKSLSCGHFLHMVQPTFTKIFDTLPLLACVYKRPTSYILDYFASPNNILYKIYPTQILKMLFVEVVFLDYLNQEVLRSTYVSRNISYRSVQGGFTESSELFIGKPSSHSLIRRWGVFLRHSVWTKFWSNFFYLSHCKCRGLC